ncbi:MAG: DUF2294 family protein [Planctomycetes bacterium]|nr:DUF2294 family protein [Planctomycetota bacterium]
MDMPGAAQQVALAAIAFEQQRTGRLPRWATAVMSDDTLVITLHAALSPAERALANSTHAASQLQEFHRQLFKDAADSLRGEIKRITGVEVRHGTLEADMTSGTLVQVFLLADRVPADHWSGNGRDEQF